MERIIEGVARFEAEVYARERLSYQRLVSEGQRPQALIISCSDSRVLPEVITQSGPGDMFVCRNAGNVVPPFSDSVGGVTAAVEYAVVGLGVSHIVICGHSDCGAMKALLHPETLEEMPSVAVWLGHCRGAHSVFRHAHKSGIADADAARLLAMENVAAQLGHLRTHPAVAARVAAGELTLHGWFFDLATGITHALDGATGVFSPIHEGERLPVALPSERRAVRTAEFSIAAE